MVWPLPSKRLQSGRGNMTCKSTPCLQNKARCSECREGEGGWYPGCRLALSGSGRGLSRFEPKQEDEFVNICSFFVQYGIVFPFSGNSTSFYFGGLPISAACSPSGDGFSLDKEWHPFRLSRLCYLKLGTGTQSLYDGKPLICLGGGILKMLLLCSSCLDHGVCSSKGLTLTLAFILPSRFLVCLR